MKSKIKRTCQNESKTSAHLTTSQWGYKHQNYRENPESYQREILITYKRTIMALGNSLLRHIHIIKKNLSSITGNAEPLPVVGFLNVACSLYIIYEDYVFLYNFVLWCLTEFSQGLHSVLVNSLILFMYIILSSKNNNTYTFFLKKIRSSWSQSLYCQLLF